ncbi:TPA: hypothetical protein N2G33_002451 [Salmonella enterica]|nr:hypothetical protein [Salmonella enterica]
MPRFKVSAAWLLALAWIFLLVWIWWKGPKWSLYEQHWLAPLTNRWLATAVWGLIALVWLTWRVMKRLQTLEKQQKQQREEEKDPLTVEIHRQQHYLDHWLLRLRRHLDNRRYLWQLPWYMVVGPVGSGKSAFLREGFPSDIIYMPESIRGVEYRPLITPRVGNQAVIFDVDGLLTAPSADDLLHRRLREHWLDWLTRTRARQPLNGLLLTLDLPAPLNRWMGKLADQAWHVVMVEAVHYMEVDWRDNVVKPFNEQLADKYPFNPRASQDASLDAFERFFKPEGTLDTFYKENLRLFLENDLTFGEDGRVLIREDIQQQIETAQKIRDIFFSQQNGLGAQFAVEPVSLSGNKRRSVLNLDGQLVDYSQGRNYTAHLVWPNNMREGNESKLTLVSSTGSKSPRSIAFSGPWAQFRLFGAGQLTNVTSDTFTVRFNVDGGYMVYRVHVDTEDNPFSGGLFSQFRLPDTLY